MLIILFVLLGFRLLPLGVGSWLLRLLLLLQDRRELRRAHLLGFVPAELFGLLVELVQVELSNDVFLEKRRVKADFEQLRPAEILK